MSQAEVLFAEQQASLVLFAEAVLGAPVRIELLEADGRGWPWDVGIPARDVVRVPATINWFDTPHDNRLVYRHQVLLQLGFSLFGTFEHCKEQHDRPSDHPLITSSPHPELTARLFVLIESARVQAALKRRLPGSARMCDQLCDAVASPVEDSMLAPVQAIGATVLTSIELAVRLAELAALNDSVGSSQASTEQPSTSGFDDDPQDASASPELADVVDDESWFSLASDAGDVDDSDRATAPLSSDAQVGPVRFGGDGETPEEFKAKRKAAGRWWPAPALPVDARTFLYDEWDYGDGCYRRSHCRVVEHSLSGDDSGFLDDVASRHSSLRGQIRKQFAQLRPRDRRRVYRRDDGDELDIDAIIEAVVDRRSGVAGDDRVHVRRDQVGRDVATAFLIDLSASTSSLAVPPAIDPTEFVDSGFIEYPAGFVDEPVDAGEPDRRVIDIAKDAVALMCDALGHLGDQYAVYGFSGTGSDSCEFHVANEFNEPPSASSWASIAAMEPRSYTRMGPAIRHATTKLRAQPAKTKLLIMISDGYPQDIDYGERGDKAYGLHDTASALRAATAEAIETFAVTIDPAGHDYLRTMCPDDRYLVIDEVTSLPLELAKLYMSLTSRQAWL